MSFRHPDDSMDRAGNDSSRSHPRREHRSREHKDYEHSRHRHSARSRSPKSGDHHRSRSHRSRPKPHEKEERRSTREVPSDPPAHLPFDALPLDLKEFDRRRGLFGLYLDVQKNMDISQISDREALGRWKSFAKKWNHGDLARSWYNPEVVAQMQASRAQRAGEDQDDDLDFYDNPEPIKGVSDYKEERSDHAVLPNILHKVDPQGYSSDESVGPRAPDHYGESSGSRSKPSGPVIPSISDIQLRDEIIEGESNRDRQARIKNRMLGHAADKALAKERLDEVAPRAEAGTRERKLENRMIQAEANREFALAKQGGDEEIGDDDLMGGGEDDSLARLKALEQDKAKKKTDRQIRREEIFRARAEERQSRLKVSREKEDKTIEMLKELAKSRFG